MTPLFLVPTSQMVYTADQIEALHRNYTKSLYGWGIVDIASIILAFRSNKS